MAGHVVLDLMTAAIAGTQTKGAVTGKKAAGAIWGSGSSNVWFSNQRLPVAGAAFVNSTTASMLDLDDGHRAAAGHPAAAIIPAVFAEADCREYSGEQLIIAIALGYEIAVRISAARDLSSVDTLVSGRWCAQGVAAAIGWLPGLSVEQMTQALSIAAACAPNLAAIAYSKDMGNHVKEGIPWATATGVASVELAAAGSTGPSDFLDNPDVFDSFTLTSNLGKSWMIEGVYFKPYSCCRWSHAAMDVTRAICSKHSLTPQDISQISIRTFSRALQLNNDVAPQNLEAAQYSIPFCVALAAVHGQSAFLPLTEASLNDSDVLELSKKVDLQVDPALDAMFSAAVPAEVVVTTMKGQFTDRLLTPKGEPSNPMSHSDLLKKFDIATANVIDPTKSREFKAALVDFSNLDPKRLGELLSMPLV
jgi:2-methylcitrate dehydratase PrpD